MQHTNSDSPEKGANTKKHVIFWLLACYAPAAAMYLAGTSISMPLDAQDFEHRCDMKTILCKEHAHLEHIDAHQVELEKKHMALSSKT